MTGRSRVRASVRLRVSVTDGRGRALRSADTAGLAAWIRRAAPARARGAVAIALVSDAEMRRLNRVYRGKDRATDVLTFPSSAPGVGAPADRVLGDVAVARGVAGRQARSIGHALSTELRVLALHGLLHLLGYDHETDDGEMGRLEERLRRKAGLPGGLIARPLAAKQPGRRRRPGTTHTR